MLTKLKWIAYVVAAVIVGAFLHWSLPQNDVVRIVGTQIKRMPVEVENAQGESVTKTRDVRLVNVAFPHGEVYVYRNEDTGWGWPPYFKFDSATLTAKLENHVSTQKNPEWFVMSHYGWRIELLSMFPNVIDVAPASGPDETTFPWLNLTFIGTLVALFLLIRWRIRKLIRARALDYAEDMEEGRA